jgi:prepilin-type N-terminal cleavage/methylation domain-containing protein
MPILSVGKAKASRVRGVTLIEMMVVVAIIGMIAAISAPSVSSGLDSVRLSTATESIASFLNSAGDRAERHQEPVEVVISVKENRLRLLSGESGFTRELKLPDGISIEAILPKEGVEGSEEGRRLILMPGGAVPGIGVQVVNQHGGRRIVRLDPMTGFPHVESVKSE